VESQIYAVPRWPIGRIAHVSLWEIAFHVGAVAEVFVVLRLLVPDITLTESFLLESAGRFVTVAFKFVPYRLGIDEAGSGAVAGVLGLPPMTGVTLALVRRIPHPRAQRNRIGTARQTQTGAKKEHGGHEAIFSTALSHPRSRSVVLADALYLVTEHYSTAFSVLLGWHGSRSNRLKQDHRRCYRGASLAWSRLA
jgi:hypothetical protein